MSGFANTVFTLLVGWFQAVVSLIWSGLTGKGDGNILTWIGNHWIVIVIILCVVGSVVDLSVYIARWKPLVVIRSYFVHITHIFAIKTIRDVRLRRTVLE